MCYHILFISLSYTYPHYTHIHPYIHTYMCTHACMHTWMMHAYKHTRTHTDTYLLSLFFFFYLHTRTPSFTRGGLLHTHTRVMSELRVDSLLRDNFSQTDNTNSYSSSPSSFSLSFFFFTRDFIITRVIFKLSYNFLYTLSLFFPLSLLSIIFTFILS